VSTLTLLGSLLRSFAGAGQQESLLPSFIAVKPDVGGGRVETSGGWTSGEDGRSRALIETIGEMAKTNDCRSDPCPVLRVLLICCCCFSFTVFLAFLSFLLQFSTPPYRFSASTSTWPECFGASLTRAGGCGV